MFNWFSLRCLPMKDYPISHSRIHYIRNLYKIGGTQPQTLEGCNEYDFTGQNIMPFRCNVNAGGMDTHKWLGPKNELFSEYKILMQSWNVQRQLITVVTHNARTEWSLTKSFILHQLFFPNSGMKNKNNNSKPMSAPKVTKMAMPTRGTLAHWKDEITKLWRLNIHNRPEFEVTLWRLMSYIIHHGQHQKAECNNLFYNCQCT